jgi:hypothetical protein
MVQTDLVRNDIHVLFQQMGEVLSGIRALHESIEIRQAQAEQLHDLVRSDLAGLKQDQRDLEEKFECAVCVVQHDVESLRRGSDENARSILDLVAAVEGLRGPIADIAALKSRVAGLVFGAGVLGSAALWLAEPLYRWFVNTSLMRK